MITSPTERRLKSRRTKPELAPSTVRYPTATPRKRVEETADHDARAADEERAQGGIEQTHAP
jgi:hypothetical protein